MRLSLFLIRYAFSAIIFVEILLAPITLSAANYVKYDYFRQIVLFLPSLYFGYVSGIIKYHHVTSNFIVTPPFFAALAIFGMAISFYFGDVILAIATICLILLLVLEKILILEDRFIQASMLKAVISTITCVILLIFWISQPDEESALSFWGNAKYVPLVAIICSLVILAIAFRRTAFKYICAEETKVSIKGLVDVCQFGIPLAVQTALLQFVLVSSRNIAIGISEQFAFDFALSMNILQFSIVGINTIAFTNQKELSGSVSRQTLWKNFRLGIALTIALFFINIILFSAYAEYLSTSRPEIMPFCIIGAPIVLFFYASAFSMFNYYRSNGVGLLLVHASMAVGVLALREIGEGNTAQWFHPGLAVIFLSGAIGIFLLISSSAKKL